MGKKQKPQLLPAELIPLIREMGSFDEKTRKKAIVAFKEYLQKPGLPFKIFQSESLLLIWKGLYDAMLRQAEPVLQEQLADDICNIVYLLKKPKTANLFVQIGLQTLAREFHRVNHFMKNKMMMFFRRLFRHSLFRLANYHWDYIKDFVDMVESTIINPKSSDPVEVSFETKVHLADIYLEEIAKSNDHLLSQERMMVFLKPYIKLLKVGTDSSYIQHIKSAVFGYLITQSDAGIENRGDLLADEIVVDSTTKRPSKTATGISCVSESEDEEESENEDETENGEEDESEADEEMEEEEDNEDENMVDEGDESETDEETMDETEEMNDDDDDEEEEEEEQYPLDPRAGNVDVALPQLDVDYKKLAEEFYEMAEFGRRASNKKVLYDLSKQFMTISEGQYLYDVHPSLRPPVEPINDAEIMKQMEEESVAKYIAQHENHRAVPLEALTAMTVDERLEEMKKAKQLAKSVREHKTDKYKKLNAYKNQRREVFAQKQFERYAKRSQKMVKKMETKRHYAAMLKKLKSKPKSEE